MTGRLDGKVAIVTGAGGGIGRQHCLLLAQHGASVVVNDLGVRTGADAASVAAEIIAAGGTAVANRGSATWDGAAAIVTQAVDTFGRVDILINNAGVSQAHRLMDSAQSDYDIVMDVSVRGAYNMSRAVVPHFRSRKSGNIVCMGSVAAQRGGGILGGPHYSAAKGALQTLAKAMARELGPDGIRVNAVAPGMVETDLLIGKIDDAGKQRVAEGVPLGRLALPLDIANACLYLASDLSSYVTGIVLDVNGGLHIH